MKRRRNTYLQPCRRGLTLIELLACLALTGLLASVLFQVAGAVMRSERRLASAEQAAEDSSLPQASWLEATRRGMQDDLDQALSVTIKPDAIYIEGWCGRDLGSAESHHEPVSVVYRFIGRGAYLIREQSSLGKVQVVPPQRELIAQGLLGWQQTSPDTLFLRWAEPAGATTRLALPAAITQGGAR